MLESKVQGEGDQVENLFYLKKVSEKRKPVWGNVSCLHMCELRDRSGGILAPSPLTGYWERGESLAKFVAAF